MSTDLLTSTLSELTVRRGRWPAICRETGLDYDWLTKLAQGRIADPGIRKIQRLADYFMANPVLHPPGGGEVTSSGVQASA